MSLVIPVIGAVNSSSVSSGNIARFSGNWAYFIDQAPNTSLDANGNITANNLSGTNTGDQSFTTLLNTDVVSIADGLYTLLATDRFVLCDCTDGSPIIQLPDPATRRIFGVKNIAGDTNANPIVLKRFGTEKIETVAADFDLSVNLGHWMVISDGTDWFLV